MSYSELLKDDLIVELEKRDQTIVEITEQVESKDNSISELSDQLEELESQVADGVNTSKEVVKAINKLSDKEKRKLAQVIRTTKEGSKAYTTFLYGM